MKCKTIKVKSNMRRIWREYERANPSSQSLLHSTASSGHERMRKSTELEQKSRNVMEYLKHLDINLLI